MKPKNNFNKPYFFWEQWTRLVLCILVIVAIALSTTASPVLADEVEEHLLLDVEICFPNVRYEASTYCGKKNLKDLKKALAEMRKTKCTDPLSWYYQGAIHWIPTKPTDISGILNENPLCPDYSDFPLDGNDLTSGSDKLLASWDNCTHALNQAGQNDAIHFLPWHRLYLYHFEEIVRELSGNNNFSLPYWDYISLDDNENLDNAKLTMPAEFQGEAGNECKSLPNLKDEDCNPLYESGRGWKLNEGNMLSLEFIQKNLLEAVKSLRNVTDYLDFSTQIEGVPHGQMHNYIGGGWEPLSLLPTEGSIKENKKIFNRIYNRKGYLEKRIEKDDAGRYGDKYRHNPQYGLMANVPSAGFDPIFWLHHGNIDRLWAQWTQKTDIKVTKEQLQKVSWPYQFFNGDGKVKAYTMDEVIDKIYKEVGYVYADRDYKVTSLIPSEDLTSMKNQLSQRPKKVLGINQTKTRVGNNQEFDQKIRLNPEFRSQLKSTDLVDQEGFNYTLEVGVTYTGRPRGTYEVYLNLPNEESAKNTAINDINTYFVGSMSFFVLESDRPTSKTFLFNITNKVSRQIEELGENFNPDSLSISILKNGGPVDETITVNKLDIYTRN